MDISIPHGTFRIFTLGMSERGRQTMRVFFDRHLANLCQIAQDASDAHAVIIDVDGYQADELLKKHLAEFPKHQVIMLTMTPEKYAPDNGIAVRKPIDVNAFADALRKLMERFFTPPASMAMPATEEKAAPARFSVASESVLKEKLARIAGVEASSANAMVPAGTSVKDPADMSATKSGQTDGSTPPRGIAAPPSLSAGEFDFYIGSSPDVDLGNKTAREGIFYRPENFLQGHLERVLAMAKERAVAFRMSGLGFQTLIVDPAGQRILSVVPLSTLLSAGRIPLAHKEMRVEPISDKEIASLPATAESHGMDSLLWRLALCASRGRLPVDTSLDKVVSLVHWPNLTRLQAPPHAARILGLWARYQTSLEQTVNCLDVPQRYVFALYSACRSLGLANVQKKPVSPATPAETPIKAHKKQGLFRVLLSKLAGYTDLAKPSS